jgi:hypothetical protein
MRNWKECAHDTHLYYDMDDGRIVGQINTIAHTKIWVAKILTAVYNNEVFLGQYISLDFAQKAVEQFWNVQDRTLLNNESI